MRRLEGLRSLPDPLRATGCVATVGVFDGVHLGHFQVIRELVRHARRLEVPPTVVTFDGHPKNLLVGRAPATITSLAHRLLLFERIGVRTTLVLQFTPGLREMDARGFFQEVLVEGLGARGLVLGFDSKFGKDRSGTFQSLGPLARRLGIFLEQVPPLRLGGRAVSSTAVREAVHLGELDRAGRMLGRPVSLLGTVVRGDGRGAALGFPTANLDPHHELRPPDGVYAVLVRREGEGRALLPGVANLGARPTFGGAGTSVEIHLLDFEGDLYGEVLEVFFLRRLREEIRFRNPEELAVRIAQDVGAAASALAEEKPRWRIPGTYLPIEGPGTGSLARGHD